MKFVIQLIFENQKSLLKKLLRRVQEYFKTLIKNLWYQNIFYYFFAGNISGKNIAWIGDGNNNMSNSLIEAASRFGFKLKIGCPDKYKPNKKVMSWAKKNKADILVTKNPNEAAKDADCVMTDKWVSMNDKVNKKAKKNSLKKYQVNKKLMKLAKSDAIFMHCLPVGRGEEVTDEIIDGKQSVVWRQALNRVHAQKSIIKRCLDQGNGFGLLLLEFIYKITEALSFSFRNPAKAIFVPLI